MPYLYLFDIGSFTVDNSVKSVAILSRHQLMPLENVKNGNPTGLFNRNGLVVDYVISKQVIHFDNSLFDHIIMYFNPNSKLILRNVSGRYTLHIDDNIISIANFLIPNGSTKTYYHVGLYN